MAISDNDFLRSLLDDTLVSGQQPYFSEDFITNLLSRTGSNIYAAAALGWSIRAGEYAKLIDFDESGSSRKLSQKFDHAMKKAKFYSDSSGGIVEAATRTVASGAKAFSLRETQPDLVTYYQSERGEAEGADD